MKNKNNNPDGRAPVVSGEIQIRRNISLSDRLASKAARISASRGQGAHVSSGVRILIEEAQDPAESAAESGDQATRSPDPDTAGSPSRKRRSR